MAMVVVVDVSEVGHFSLPPSLHKGKNFSIRKSWCCTSLNINSSRVRACLNEVKIIVFRSLFLLPTTMSSLRTVKGCRINYEAKTFLKRVDLSHFQSYSLFREINTHSNRLDVAEHLSSPINHTRKRKGEAQ